MFHEKQSDLHWILCPFYILKMMLHFLIKNTYLYCTKLINWTSLIKNSWNYWIGSEISNSKISVIQCVLNKKSKEKCCHSESLLHLKVQNWMSFSYLFWAHCDFATFDFFVKMKLVSTLWVSTSLSKSG